MAELSAMERSGTTPRRFRSAGTYRSPASIRFQAGLSVRSRPPMVSVPALIFRRPTMASTSSDWPLPSTPAMPTISPA